MASVKQVEDNVRQAIVNTASRFCIPRPQSLYQFVINPHRWRLPNPKNFDLLCRRIKTNLLFFQTNYIVLTFVLFACFMILSMRTLLTGVLSALFIAVAILFFFETIPQARQIKQNHPGIVIVAGIVLVVVTWHALNTIIFVGAALLAPVPLWFLHAACRSSDGLIDESQSGSDYSGTPIGQIMQMVGVEARASQHE